MQGAGAVSQELLDQICTRLKQEGMQIGNAPAMGEADIEAASKKLSEQLKKELPEANYNELRESMRAMGYHHGWISEYYEEISGESKNQY